MPEYSITLVYLSGDKTRRNEQYKTQEISKTK